MTLDVIGWLVGQFTDVDRYSEEFVTMLDFAQGQYFTANLMDETKIEPFIKHMGVDNATVPLKVDANGLAAVPTDFARHLDFTFMYNGGEEQVERVESWEFRHRLTHTIEIPTREHPIATYMGAYIRFAPKNLQFVNYTYVSRPTDVVMATTLSDGMVVYDAANSTELLWREQDQVEIVRILLQELGIIVTSEQIKQKIESK